MDILKNYKILEDKNINYDWVQLKSDSMNIDTEIDPYPFLIPCTSLPLRYDFQVPKDWVDKDPGFLILLRQKSNLKKTWIKQPENYIFEFKKEQHDRNSKKNKLLLICHHEKSKFTWRELSEKFKEYEIYWTYYACSSRPLYPVENFVGFQEILASPYMGFNYFFDISFRVGDTYSGLHIHLLQNLVQPLNEEESFEMSRVVQRIDVGYGHWCILD